MKTTILRRIIQGKYYYSKRMESMNNECMHYLDVGTAASNKTLRDAFFATAEMYRKRCKYYFRKISENAIFAKTKLN